MACPSPTASSSSDEATSSRPRHNSKLSTDLTDIDMLCDMRFSPVFFSEIKGVANLQVSILLSSLFLRLCSSSYHYFVYDCHHCIIITSVFPLELSDVVVSIVEVAYEWLVLN